MRKIVLANLFKRSPPPPESTEAEWGEVGFLLTGREYLQKWIEACRAAKSSVRLENYIFELDEAGEQILTELRNAAARGVKVRVVLDAIGSPGFTDAKVLELAHDGVLVRVFGRPRDVFREAWERFRKRQFWRAMQILRKFQLRNHRKLAVFDCELAMVGSSNIGERFADWRETTVLLRGPGVVRLKRSFISSWRLAARERILDGYKQRTPAIHTNFTRLERLRTNRLLLEQIRAERKRIYLSTAYFHPRPRLLVALFAALLRGVDVRILSPKKSDIAWFPWLSRALYTGLIEKGAKIYEYNRGMMHAKTSLFSSCVYVGSTNMNFRSFMHDLELDVVLTSPEAVLESEKIFQADIADSTLLTWTAVHGYAPVAFLISLLVSPFKRWL